MFGSFVLSGFLAEAGLNPNEIIVVIDPVIHDTFGNFPPAISTATCPITHQVIGGGIERLFTPEPSSTVIEETLDLATNSYTIELTSSTGGSPAQIQAFATCQKINFPMMGMIGGELLDIDTMSLFIGAIGVNPVITGLVGITIAGVAGQAIWFVHRRKSENS